MGETMRRYWLPALLSWELPEPDGAPVRVRLLGEDLVAFRTTDGKIGLLEQFCPHRGASLWLGRNEDGGLRCVYHGWKYDVTGQCIDQMNEPRQFCDKIRAIAYPTYEMAGVIWAYMGPADQQPAPPKFEWTQVAETHRAVSKVVEECNWLQALEGGIDTSHAPILHRALTDNTTRGGIRPSSPFVRGKAPRLVVDVTDYGYLYAGIRPLGEADVHIRSYHFVMPFHQIRPSRTNSGLASDAGHIWVPMDDHNVMVYNWFYALDEGAALTEEDRLEESAGNGPKHVDQKTFRSYQNITNNYGLDREVQRTETYSGIDGINQQDRALQESMGRIVDRSKEHLGPADKAIGQARRMLGQAVRSVQAGGDPAGTGTSYYYIRAGEEVLPSDADWHAILAPDITKEKILQTV
jgi:phenylpropionate dioxygenase-like ring-hydroxylating dioxygenase large terminal subunit